MPDLDQPWTTVAEDIVDATFLVKSLEAPGRDVLGWLARRPNEPFTPEQIADALSPEPTTPAALVGTVANRLRLVNALCESYRRPALVDVVDDRCAVNLTHADVITAALAELERWTS